MPLIAYVEKRFSQASLRVLHNANLIIDEYTKQGYELTLRQLYYQFVARGLLENRQTEYDRLGSIINNGRLAGYIDWHAIVDRTRNLQALTHWDSPGDIVEACAEQFLVDKWATQTHRIEVWVEKEALIGVFEDVCDRLDVPYFACRGYVSQSEMWRAAQRLRQHEAEDYQTVILHFGDHDPSGIDMTRDIRDRLRLFGARTQVERVALNLDQVRRLNPPPNPAKLSDARARAYIREFGSHSWELDALNPQSLTTLVEDAVKEFRDERAWNEELKEEKQGRARLRRLARGLT